VITLNGLICLIKLTDVPNKKYQDESEFENQFQVLQISKNCNIEKFYGQLKEGSIVVLVSRGYFSKNKGCVIWVKPQDIAAIIEEDDEILIKELIGMSKPIGIDN